MTTHLGCVEQRNLLGDDVQYVEDMGIIKTEEQLRISDKIYQSWRDDKDMVRT